MDTSETQVLELDSSGDQTPEAEVARRPSRFGWGMALGVGIGAIAVVAILAVTYVVLTSITLRGLSARGTSVTVSAVEAGTPWFTVGPDGRGELLGYANGGGSGSNEPAAPESNFDYVRVVAPGSLNGITVTHGVQVFLTKDTKLSVEGKPWQAAEQGSGGAAEMLVSGSFDGDNPFDARQLAIKFRTSDGRLIADSIDARGPVIEGETPWNN